MVDLGSKRVGETESAQLKELAEHGFALALQLLHNRDDASDAVQDSLHTLLRKRGMFDPQRGELDAWFLKIVRNRCLDMIRRNARRRTACADFSQIFNADQERPDAAAEKRELLEALRIQLSEMPLNQREIIVLRDYQDLSYVQIAEVLSLPLGTVMSRLHRARLELRRRMENHLD